MKFNLAYFGPEALFHIRRDFILAVKYGLESLGHDVVLSGLQLDTARFNLIVGGYFLQKGELPKIDRAGVDFAHINTEVISNDLLNFNPQKTDFLGEYLPSLRAGRFIWDVIANNMDEHRRYGNNAHFLRWGWHPKLEEIEHRAQKDVDFYFFGLMSPRRMEILNDLGKGGVTGFADASCPYFLRNDRISRAKVILNVIQDEKYTHVGSFRVCYLLNNRCAVVSEPEIDPAGYLKGTRIVERAGIVDAVRELREGTRWKDLGEAAYQSFREIPMARTLEQLLEASFANPARTAAGIAAR
jgi:hypothetical protein